MVEWEWEQGRLEYFTYDNIRKTARVLIRMNGTSFGERASDKDPLREPLTAATGLAYPPVDRADYPLQRNFARIFKLQLLAGFKNDTLSVTDVCRFVDPDNPDAWTADEYLSFLIPRLYMPSPARQEYNPSSDAPVVYPICALLRFLLVRRAATVDEIFGFVIGNTCVGNESLEFYKELSDSGYRGKQNVQDASRDCREMIKSFAQEASWLNWDGREHRAELLLGAAPEAMAAFVEAIASPIVGSRLEDTDDEVLRLGSVDGAPAKFMIPALPPTRPGSPPFETPDDGYDSVEDQEFTEGKKKRVSHLKTERSEKLKRAWAAKNGDPRKCDICSLEPLTHYPWMQNSGLHLHHVLPLSSSVHNALTALADVVAVCGPCHGAVHLFYRTWLNSEHKEDFDNKTEAHEVYRAAKEAYVP